MEVVRIIGAYLVLRSAEAGQTRAYITIAGEEEQASK
jgi:hypothetical protein